MEEKLNELEKKLEVLWRQDFPNQKSLLDLQTRVGNLEKKLAEAATSNHLAQVGNKLAGVEAGVKRLELAEDALNKRVKALEADTHKHESQLEVPILKTEVLHPKVKKSLKLSDLLKNLGL